MQNNGLVEELLERMAEQGGSDLHIKSDARARVRVSGEIVTLDDLVIDDQQMRALVTTVLGREKSAELYEAKRGVDSYYTGRDGTRYRVNVFLHAKGVAAVFRVIAQKSASLEELGLPESVHRLTDLSRGLVLVTGTTGSGKSTTLTAMIDRINANHSKHIITIEDPVEFIHSDKRSIIEQRNIGEHVEDFSGALKDALREDPDIILVGEMRDLETIKMALHAANTGHLVFSTLHTLDAKETISRIVSVFSVKEQNQIRITLASVLQGVVSQRLVKTVDGGRAASVEILRNNERVRQMIIESRENELLDVIEESSGVHGMQSFDQSLLKLVHEGRITPEKALAGATRASDLAILLNNSAGYQESDVITLKEPNLERKKPEPAEPDSASRPPNLLKSIRVK